MNQSAWENLSFILAVAVAVAVLAVVVVGNPKLVVAIELVSIALSIIAIIYVAPYIDAPTVQVVCFHTVTNSQIVINGTATITQIHTAIANTTITELQSQAHTC